MATTLSTDTLTITTTERTWRTTIESQAGADYILTAHRETVRKAGATLIAKDQNAGVVTRALSVVLGEEHICEDGTIVTPAHVAEALTAWIDGWRAADLAPAPEPDPEVV